MRESKRYLGLELAGAKNQKTALAALEYYPKEKKIFLLDIFDRIMPAPKAAGGALQTSDEALLDLIDELKPHIARIGINVPLELPPCIPCTKKTCPQAGKCTVPAVKWMREITRKAMRHGERGVKVRDFTPYTQRPFELWARYQILPDLPESHRFEIDETLGGNKAPLTARMHFLKRHLLDEYALAEVWPKLTVAVLGEELELNKRTISAYRQLEQGVHAREEILEKLAHKRGIFIYERDIQKLAHSLTSFDAFICAYTALLADNQLCTKMPQGFPAASGWVFYPA